MYQFQENKTIYNYMILVAQLLYNLNVRPSFCFRGMFQRSTCFVCVSSSIFMFISVSLFFIVTLYVQVWISVCQDLFKQLDILGFLNKFTQSKNYLKIVQITFSCPKPKLYSGNYLAAQFGKLSGFKGIGKCKVI